MKEIPRIPSRVYIAYDGIRPSRPLTPQLRETFYYARERTNKEEKKRAVEPIRYDG